MSIWSRLAGLAQRAFDVGHEEPAAGDPCRPDPNDVGFTVAVIGLAAKMARADGAATKSELAAAQQVFQPPPGEEEHFARVYGLARGSVHGFEAYARQIARRYRARPCLLEDVLDGLFHIAAADGAVTPEEEAYLSRVAEHFGFSEMEYRRIRASNLGAGAHEPYTVLGLIPGAGFEEVRAAYRRLAAENHPDKLIARGAPAAFQAVAAEKLAAINAAYEELRREFAALPAPVAAMD